MKKKRYVLVYVIVSAVAFAAMIYLFWAQSFHYMKKYPSDLDAHIRNALANGGSGYSLEGKLVVLLNRITGSNTAFIVLLALIVSVTPVALGWMLSIVDRDDPDFHLGRLRNTWIGLYSIFAAPMIIPFVWVWFYKNTMNINAWHNSTLMEMRLFSIIAFALFILIRKTASGGRDGRIRLLHWAAFSASLLASTWFKPSFFVGFAPVMAVSLLLDMWRNRKERTVVVRDVIIGSAAVPAVIMVLLQYWKLYGSREDVSLILSTDQNSEKYLLRLLLFLAVPLIIFLYNRKKIVRDYRNGNRAYAQIWALWFMEQLLHTFFDEVGRNGGNFGWGVRIGNFFVFVVSVRLFWGNCLNIRETLRKKEPVRKRDWAYVSVTGLILLQEICCGIYYFVWLLQGKTYHI